jgi:hypothetical protein
MTATVEPTILNALAAHMVAGRARTFMVEHYVRTRRRLDGEWRNEDVREAMLRVMDTITFTVVDRRTVKAEAPRTHNGRIWAYWGGDALKASFPGPHVLTRTDDYTFTLTLNP